MSITQLDPPLYLTTPLGPSVAHFIWNTGQDEIFYGCFQEETCECWWWPNHKIRLCTNLSEGRYKQTPITESVAMTSALAMHRSRYSKQEKS